MNRFRMLPTYHYEDISAVEPVLENGVGKPLRDYKIYGNSVQDGTPAPDSPVEIKSVGDRTRNLLDVKRWYPAYANDEGGITFTNIDFKDGIYSQFLLNGELDENKFYHVSCNFEFACENDDEIGGFLFNPYTSDNTVITNGIVRGSGYVHDKIGTINYVVSGVAYFRIAYYNTGSTANYKITNMMIAEVPDPLEGNYFVKETTTGGANLSVTEDGCIMLSGTSAASSNVPCTFAAEYLPGTYTVSMSVEGTITGTARIYLYRVTKDGSTSNMGYCTVKDGASFVATVTEPTFANFNVYSTKGDVYEDVKICLTVTPNSVDMDYEPYGYKLPIVVKPKNLYDKINGVLATGYMTSGRFSAALTTRSVYIPCKPNTTYTVSKMVSARFAVGFSEQIPINGVAVSNVVQNNTASVIHATSAHNSKYLIVFLYHQTYDTEITLDEILDSLQIEKADMGENLFTGISRVSTSANQNPITVTQKNNVYTLIPDIIESGTRAHIAATESVTLKANKTYSISIMLNRHGEMTAGFRIYSSGITVGYIGQKVTETELTRYTSHYTPESDITIDFMVYLDNFENISYTVDFSDIQVVECPDATPCEPYFEPKTYNIYLDEPLRGLGEYVACLDFRNRKIDSCVNTYAFDSSSYIVTYTYNNERDENNYFFYLNKKVDCPHLSDMKCNIMPAGVISFSLKETYSCFSTAYANTSGMIYGRIEKTLVDGYEGDTVADKIKAFLIDKGAVLYYATTNQTTTPITLPRIETEKNLTNVVSVDTEIEPSKVDVQYYKK